MQKIGIDESAIMLITAKAPAEALFSIKSEKETGANSLAVELHYVTKR